MSQMSRKAEILAERQLLLPENTFKYSQFMFYILKQIDGGYNYFKL